MHSAQAYESIADKIVVKYSVKSFFWTFWFVLFINRRYSTRSKRFVRAKNNSTNAEKIISAGNVWRLIKRYTTKAREMKKKYAGYF